MKNISRVKAILWMLFFVLGTTSLSAQTINKLSIGTVPSSIGKEVQVPIYLENTDEIVAIQFDITTPSEISISSEVGSTNRWDDHAVVVRNMGNGRSRVFAYSMSNTPFKGNSGNIFYLHANVSESSVPEAEYEAVLEDVTLSNRNGENCVTSQQNGKFVIQKAPDLKPEWISISKNNIIPSDSISLSWKVKNESEIATTGGWKEQFYIVSEDGSREVLIGSQYYDNILMGGSEVVRSGKITLPEVLGVDGKCFISVKVVPHSDCGEPISMRGNNTVVNDEELELSKVLCLSAINYSVSEKNSSPLKYKLTRSGSTYFEEQFTITKITSDGRVSIPSTVVIPRNQASVYFYVTITANKQLESSLAEVPS